MNDPWRYLATEQRNERTNGIDQADALTIATLMNKEDRGVADAISATLGSIATVIDLAVDAMNRGGRLIYVGAGTSGRLGVLDASECQPTFNAPKEQVVGVIAGGRAALTDALEGVEDNADAGRADMTTCRVSGDDLVVGLSASGTAPYVIAAMQFARAQGAATAAITCNAGSPLAASVQHAIEVVVGPEAITGSTRLKAGTAQKLVLNMISTGAMIRRGKVYGNLMVDVTPTNDKLRRRAVRIVMDATGCKEEIAESALTAANDRPKCAIVMLLCDTTAAEANERLRQAGGFVRHAITTR